MRRTIFYLFFLIGCGSSDPIETKTTLAPAYDAIGVARVLPDGIAATSLLPFRFQLVELRSSGGSVVGKLKVRDLELSLTGNYDADTGNLQFVPMQAALTGTTTEEVQQLGGTAFDDAPKDGITDDMTGFLRTQSGRRVIEGKWLGAVTSATRPATPDVSKIGASRKELGVATVRGTPGAVQKSTLVEIFSYGLLPGNPRFNTVPARDDGSFETEVEAIEGDQLIVRVRLIGAASDGVGLAVMP